MEAQSQEAKDSQMATIKIAKKQLRKSMTQLLVDISEESLHAQSGRAINALLRMREYEDARRVGIYLSMKTKEIQTRSLVLHALNQGKTVFVPYIHKIKHERAEKPTSIMSMLTLHSHEDLESLEPDAWGIPSLSASSIPERKNCFGELGLAEEVSEDSRGGEDWGLDMLVMPGVAFDTQFDRLGHGKGYYDSFLSRYFQQSSTRGELGKKLLLVALALDEQVLPPPQVVPKISHDWPIDALATGAGDLLRR